MKLLDFLTFILIVSSPISWAEVIDYDVSRQVNGPQSCELFCDNQYPSVEQNMEYIECVTACTIHVGHHCGDDTVPLMNYDCKVQFNPNNNQFKIQNHLK